MLDTGSTYSQNHLLATLICVLFGPIALVGQSDSSAAINYTDSLGRKQGYWIVYKPRSGPVEFTHDGHCGRTVYPNPLKLAEGNFNNHQRTGVWLYYDPAWDQLEKQIEFLSNGSTVETGFFSFYTLRREVNGDIFGEFCRIGITAQLICSGDSCKLNIPEHHTIAFPIDRLDYEMDRIMMGCYDVHFRFPRK